MMILRTELGQPRGRLCWEGLIPEEESSTLGLEAPAWEGEAPPIGVSKLPGQYCKEQHVEDLYNHRGVYGLKVKYKGLHKGLLLKFNPFVTVSTCMWFLKLGQVYSTTTDQGKYTYIYSSLYTCCILLEKHVHVCTCTQGALCLRPSPIWERVHICCVPGSRIQTRILVQANSYVYVYIPSASKVSLYTYSESFYMFVIQTVHTVISYPSSNLHAHWHFQSSIVTTRCACQKCASTTSFGNGFPFKHSLDFQALSLEGIHVHTCSTT